MSVDAFVEVQLLRLLGVGLEPGCQVLSVGIYTVPFLATSVRDVGRPFLAISVPHSATWGSIFSQFSPGRGGSIFSQAVLPVHV